MQQKDSHKAAVATSKGKGSDAPSAGENGMRVIDAEQSLVNESSLCSTSAICSAPLCRQFWKAGNYEDTLTSKHNKKFTHYGTSYLHIHPKFLHSNATSHKWAFGAIAELLDNAIDEIQNGATFVIVDKTLNPRDGSTALLIQDDGGGMDPEAMRRCMSFGFSEKNTKLAIGQYGNGFKTSSMRLGADVIVFSQHLRDRKLTQSIGLLSYTFLMQTGHDRIVVPMVDYILDKQTGKWVTIHNKQHFMNNLSILLQWSPYSTEAELLKQFTDIGGHGTKIIIYNLWHTDDGELELNFELDPEDICLSGSNNNTEKGGSRMAASEQHLANRLRYSLRAYLSILYLRLPENFCILLRGRVVEYHNIATDLKYPEFILYRPQSHGSVEGSVITTIGFLKEAPIVNIHGFNVYHKNRLILPFWHVVSYSDSRGRGVVGVLEANFIEPTHNKQDFEKTPVFQKLENRLKDMTWEYWDYHCGLIGYQVKKKPRATLTPCSADSTKYPGTYQPVLLGQNSPAATCTQESAAPGGASLKRKGFDHGIESEKLKRKARVGGNTADTVFISENQPATTNAPHLENQEAANLIQENKKLRAECSEYERRKEELELKVAKLRTELGEAKREYVNLLVDLRLLDKVKKEN